MEDREKNPGKYDNDILASFAERTIKRLWIVVILLIIYNAAFTAFYFWEKAQYEDVEITQEVDTGEGNAYVNGIGDVYYGEGQTDS